MPKVHPKMSVSSEISYGHGAGSDVEHPGHLPSSEVVHAVQTLPLAVLATHRTAPSRASS